MKLWDDLCDWAATNAAALRLCFRMTVAGLLAYVLAELFALPQGYWAVFSAIIIVQASVGGSIKATTDRLIGTIGGAVAGRGGGVFVASHKRVVSWHCTRHCSRAADVGGSVVAQLPDRAADGRNRTLTPGAQQLGPLNWRSIALSKLRLAASSASACHLCCYRLVRMG